MATTTKADLELFNAAFMLSLIQPRGGGVHAEMDCIEGVVFMTEKVLESSMNLKSTIYFDL